MKHELGPGSFLIAGPTLTDPNFQRTVVLLCDHGPEGSLGLVVNRPMRAPLGKIFPDLASFTEKLGMMNYGGPVESNRIMALCCNGTGDEAQVFDRVHLVADVEAAVQRLADGIASPEEYRFFLGYAGWGKGQLQSEMNLNAWIARPASQKLIFDIQPKHIWPQALREIGGTNALFAEMPADPTQN
ncbi:MAG: YqgE/AlgH family protein [Planctomycetota bacterium]